MPTQEADISLLFRGLLTGDILYHIPGEKREKYIPAQIPDAEQLLELAGIDTDLPLYHLAVDADEDDNLMNALESFLFYLH